MWDSAIWLELVGFSGLVPWGGRRTNDRIPAHDRQRRSECLFPSPVRTSPSREKTE